MIAMLILFCFGSAVSAKEDETVTRFIFTGHLRGARNFEINRLVPHFVKEVRGLKKDFVFLTGDMICGYKTAYDKKGLRREWSLLDQYLSQIDAPVYRVTGNHD